MAHSRLFIKMGIWINSPGNHFLEYREKEMIGKYNILVNRIRNSIHMDKSPSAALPDERASAIATTALLAPKWTRAIIKITTIFFAKGFMVCRFESYR